MNKFIHETDRLAFTNAIIDTGNFIIKPEDACKKWWYPTTKWNPSHLRLTDAGCDVVSSIMKPYEFELKEYPSTMTELKLYKNMRVPYHFKRKKITIFSTNLVILIKLYGSIEKYLESLKTPF